MPNVVTQHCIYIGPEKPRWGVSNYAHIFFTYNALFIYSSVTCVVQVMSSAQRVTFRRVFRDTFTSIIPKNTAVPTISYHASQCTCNQEMHEQI